MSTFRRPTGYISFKPPLRLPVGRTTDMVGTRLVLPSGDQPSKLPTGTSIESATSVLRPTDKLTFTLPVPPSINHQYATVNGRRLLSSAGRVYKAQVGQLVCLGLSRLRNRATLLLRMQSEPLALSIKFYFTSALRRDVDGGLKIAQDALCEGLGINDNRIVETHLYKHVDKGNPRIEVSLALSSAATGVEPTP